MTDSTLLRLDPIGVPPYSARGIEQILAPADGAGQFFRDVNGNLVDISNADFRKFRSTITCRDNQHPALSGVWIGQTLTVDCITDLVYEDTTDGAPDRTVVPGSQETRDGFVFYRPRLTMMVTGYRSAFDEWAGEVNWVLELEEV